jgi:DNA topoisomerase-1
MDAITHDQAMELFKLPRKLGTTAAGDEITTNVGRFGPYVKYGAKYVSLKTDDPYEITPERALEVIREKEIADANRLILDFPEAGIQVLNGRYGPYITDKQKNAKIPKDKEPKSLSLAECQELLAAAPARSFGKWGRKNAQGKSIQGKSTQGKSNKGKSANGAGQDKASPDKTAQDRTGKVKSNKVRKSANGATPTTVPGLAAARPAPARKAGTARLAAKGAKTAANKKGPVADAVEASAPPAAPPKAAAPKASAPKSGAPSKASVPKSKKSLPEKQQQKS